MDPRAARSGFGGAILGLVEACDECGCGAVSPVDRSDIRQSGGSNLRAQFFVGAPFERVVREIARAAEAGNRVKPKLPSARRKRIGGQKSGRKVRDAMSKEAKLQKLAALDLRRLSHRERTELYFLLGGILKANRAQVLIRLFTAFDRLSSMDPELWGRVARAANLELDCALAERTPKEGSTSSPR
jgi:hypothetical protein